MYTNFHSILSVVLCVLCDLCGEFSNLIAR